MTNQIHQLQHPSQPFETLHHQQYVLLFSPFDSPPSQDDIHQNIKKQLKIFEQTLEINHNTTIQLMKKIDDLSNQLNRINLLLATKTKKVQSPPQYKAEPEHQIDQLPRSPDQVEIRIISKIFGQNKYQYELCTDQQFIKLLYKERNFSLNIKLVNHLGTWIPNSNRIPVTFSAYHNQEDPKLIEFTRLNFPIFKGNNEIQIHRGFGKFKKLQFKQVSSYYNAKGIYFVVYAKPQSFHYNENSGACGKIIHHSLIKPLIIRDIMVRAKKK